MQFNLPSCFAFDSQNDTRQRKQGEGCDSSHMQDKSAVNFANRSMRIRELTGADGFPLALNMLFFRMSGPKPVHMRYM